MKKSTIGEEHAKAWEKEIRNDEREKISKHLARVHNLAHDLMQATIAIHVDGAGPKPSPKLNGNAPKKRRKPVSATSAQRESVFDTLGTICEQFPDRMVTPKELRGATTLGPKLIGAALRSLVAEGVVIEKAGKYSVVELRPVNDPPPPAAA